MLLTNRAFDLFDDMFNDPFFTRSYEPVTTSHIMKSDIQENENGYLLDIELPGYNKEDVQAELKDGYLTITANHEDKKEEKDKNGKFIRKERYTGTCKRSFYVGEEVRQEDIKAAFQNGILRLAIPKQLPQVEKEQPKLITIE
ncbi:MAG: Hsp20/alpha crystallin family protein [Blautia sp.]|nr:Hsp20/alpha crystallin family protein [Blautia sp.]MDY4515017.1 Hsp20/alpha crystallin family protein [Lachnospiraceae bacterium]